MDEIERVATSYGMGFPSVNEAREVAIMEGKGMEATLFNAAREGNIKIISKKITPGQVQTTPTGKTILHIACEFDKYVCVKTILQLDPDLLFHVDRHGDTALHVAARSKHVRSAKALIKAVKSRVPDIELGNLTAVKEFIRITNKRDNTALHEAVDVRSSSGCTAIVNLLIKEYPDYEYLPNKRRETPLYVAAERGHGDLALAILRDNSSSRHDGPLGRTTLHAAVMSNLRGLTKELLERRPDLAKQPDEDGWTPLHWAAYHGHSHSVKQLLEHDPSLAYIVDRDGLTSLHVASINNSTSSMKIITSLCPDCYDMVDHKGRNAFHYAMMYKQAGSTGFLLRETLFRSLLSEGDMEGNTALHLCLLNKQPSLGGHIGHIGILHACKMDWRSLNDKHEAAGPYLFGALQIMGMTTSYIQKKLLKLFHRRFRVSKISMKVEEKMESNKERKERGSSYRGSQLVVATLIATVSFAAGFTPPGGYNDVGKAVLRGKPMFNFFLFADTLAFLFSVTAVFIQFYLPIIAGEHWSSKDLDHNGYTFTYCAMVSMLTAFTAGVSVVLDSSFFATILQFMGSGIFFVFSLVTIWYDRAS